MSIVVPLRQQFIAVYEAHAFLMIYSAFDTLHSSSGSANVMVDHT